MLSHKSPRKRPEEPKIPVKPDTVDETLLKHRNVFLHKEVDDDSASKVIKELIALDIKSQDPIYFWINSPGGSCCAGFAIIETMKYIKSKVITIVNSEACSMGAEISVCGNERWIVRNGIWMAHDMSGGVRSNEYSLKLRDRAAYLEKLYELLERNLREHTKLSKKQLDGARIGELWLFAEDCIKYGIADKII